MKITSVFDISRLSANIATCLSLLSHSIRITINGANWDGHVKVNVRDSVIDFIDISEESYWVEIDFANQGLYFPNYEIQNVLLAAVFYPEQDSVYKNKRPEVMSIMKSVFRCLQPLIVAQDDSNIIPKLLKYNVSETLDTSFLIIDTRLLPSSEMEVLLENPDLYSVEWLTDHIVWINGPLGLGDETFHLTEEPYRIHKDKGGLLSSSQAFNDLQQARDKHQKALSLILNSIDWGYIRKINS
ncbi:hypothetical protein E5F05_02110 (plasmid) [Deinococcus metallilatus]|uniref:Uncharacterized protein n=1 Tax=Deinococcus metallilatus TaxID=1211322 RepID=A0ABR6MV41_9DEIO|nr:hypothetical protein [Deinococcus metallilatus]MBB5295808.1 hypothetical protein [Deinococcus metallilatus]QBY06762.1 hypothetical protein E5F05_02110 [Deinococcus metallilatus]GMA14336.1 hypothetical protein GCM10025871_06670 [Deinococcus metallilatus]